MQKRKFPDAYSTHRYQKHATHLLLDDAFSLFSADCLCANGACDSMQRHSGAHAHTDYLDAGKTRRHASLGRETPRIAERTEVSFTPPSQKNTREATVREVNVKEVNVLRGALTYDVKANPNEPFRFKSPTAVAAIKGTTGSFETDGIATNFIVESSDVKDDVAEFETERGESISVGIGEVAVLNRSGKLALRDILDRERRAIQNEVNDMRRAVEEELRKIKEEVEQMRRETEAQLKGDADSLKQNLEQLKQDQQKEADDIKREIDKTKEEMQKEKDEMRKLFDR